MMPSLPSATDFTAAESVTMEKTISDFSATARGVSAQRMPAVISGTALSRDRFQPVTECPAAIRRGTMSCPMAPRPTKPSFTSDTPQQTLSCPAQAGHPVSTEQEMKARSCDFVWIAIAGSPAFAGNDSGGQDHGSLS